MNSPALPSILIVDDDDDDRFMLRRALEKARIRNPVVAFSDGEDLLQFLNKAEGTSAAPILLFLDLNMPRMTGFDVLVALRRTGLGRQLKTIVVSGSTRDEDIRRAEQLGALGYLVKFPTSETLAQTVRTLTAANPAGEPNDIIRELDAQRRFRATG
jgi:two-component system response regulator